MEITYTCAYHPRVKDDIKHIGKSEKDRVKKAIKEKLTAHPEVFGAPLQRSLKGYRKLRVGDYRVVFKVRGTTVHILAIKHRSVVYEDTKKRV